MSLTAIQAARDYIEDAANRHVLAIPPRTLATKLACSDEEALALLKILRGEGLGGFRGYVACTQCREGIPLKSTSLSDLYAEASDLVSAACRFCGSTVALDRDEVEVQLSFFLSAVAANSAAATGNIVGDASRTAAVSLASLHRADSLNVRNLYVVEKGGVLSMNSGDEKSETPATDRDRIGARSEFSGSVDLNASQSGTSHVSARGREVIKRTVKRSALMSLLLGEVQEERHREGDYTEQTQHQRSRKITVGITVTLVVCVSVAIVVLWNILH